MAKSGVGGGGGLILINPLQSNSGCLTWEGYWGHKSSDYPFLPLYQSV